MDPKAAADISKTIYFGQTVAPKVAAARYRIDAITGKEAVTGRFEGVVGNGWSHTETVTATYAVKN